MTLTKQVVDGTLLIDRRNSSSLVIYSHYLGIAVKDTENVMMIIRGRQSVGASSTVCQVQLPKSQDRVENHLEVRNEGGKAPKEEEDSIVWINLDHFTLVIKQEDIQSSVLPSHT